MEALPGSSLEVIEPEFLFQLLMGLFANPSGFVHSFLRGSMDCFAEFIIGRAIARPVGSQ
jgi:hypothetical protein